jgi:AraC-like DNA-binding protein
MQVAARKLRVVVEVAARAGVEREDLLRAVGMRPEDLADPESRWPLRVWRDLWQEVVARTGDEGVGLRAALAIDRGYFGVIDYAARSAGTVREAILVASRYFRLANTWGRLEVIEQPERWRIERQIAGDEALMLPRQAAEFALAAMLRLFRLAARGPFTPSEVWLRYPAPAEIGLHREVFGCPLRFGQPADALVVPTSQLDAPMAAPDRALLTLVTAHGDHLLQQIPEADLLAQVRAEIARTLYRGDPSIDAVASRLGASRRTLQRKLAEEGCVFRELVQSVRRALAERHLREGRPAGEVAFLLGYSQQGAFVRAFRGWTGLPPGEWQRAVAPDGQRLAPPVQGPGAPLR